MTRDSFIFYRSFYDAIRDLPREIRGEIYTAIMEYGLYGNETENLKPVARSIFALIRPQLDANNKRFDNGSRGGRPKAQNQTKTKLKPSRNQDETKTEPNVNDNYNENVNVNDNENECVAHAHAEKAFEDFNELAAAMKSATAWREQAAMANRLSLAEIDICIDNVCAYMATAGHPLTVPEARRRLPRQVQIFRTSAPQTRQEADDAIKQSALNRLNDAINRFDNEAGTFPATPGL